MACAGTNMQKFIDLLEMMFGDLDIDDIDISELETKTTKGLHRGRDGRISFFSS